MLPGLGSFKGSVEGIGKQKKGKLEGKSRSAERLYRVFGGLDFCGCWASLLLTRSWALLENGLYIGGQIPVVWQARCRPRRAEGF
jgi:hypothetical protein